MSLHMLGALHSASDVMDEVVHPLGKGVLSIFAPTLAQGAEDVEVNEGWYNTPAMRAAKKTAADAQGKLAAAIAADANAVTACATALTSTAYAMSAVGKAKTRADARAAADQAACDAAFAAQDMAAAAVPAELLPQREPPIQKGLAAAVTKLSKTPADLYAQNVVKAWQVALYKVQNPTPKGDTQMSLHMLGARKTLVGFDYQGLASGLLSTAGGVASSVQADKAAEEASAADKSKADAAIAADSAAALAKATSLTSDALAASAPATKSVAAKAKADADQAALAIASNAQDQAGASVPASTTSLRATAAQKALAAATTKLQGAPSDLYTQNLVKAWNFVLNKVQNAQITKNAPDSGKPSKKEEGGLMALLKKPIVGPVVVWHAAAGVGVLGALWLAVKKGVFHRFGIG